MVSSVVYYLGCMIVIQGHFLQNEASPSMFDYLQILLLGILSSMEPTIYFQIIDAVGHFPGFDKYIFLQRQTCTALVVSADCTKCSCSRNILTFNNFLVFNFPFL